MYEICGEVEKVKVKQNYKNYTSYVTYKNCQAAATAFIVTPYPPRGLKKPITRSKYSLELFNIANILSENPNVAMNNACFFIFGTKKIRLL